MTLKVFSALWQLSEMEKEGVISPLTGKETETRCDILACGQLNSAGTLTPPHKITLVPRGNCALSVLAIGENGLPWCWSPFQVLTLPGPLVPGTPWDRGRNEETGH